MSGAPKSRPKLGPGRPSFMDWINTHPSPSWKLLPLTHITKGVVAEDIIRDGRIDPTICKTFGENLAYFFYGRPAYRLGDKGVLKAEAFCPYCFVFKPELIDRAKSVHAFDTGAFMARMYSDIVPDEMDVNDFRLEKNSTPNQLISLVFGSQSAYFDGDIRAAEVNAPKVKPHQFHAKAYLDLILSRGRNEPDDRVYTIEIMFGDPVPLSGSLMAVVVPHTLWEGDAKAPWLESLDAASITILPYEFMPGRQPEYYQTLLERAIKHFYETEGFF